jgi:hypothetical protein
MARTALKRALLAAALGLTAFGTVDGRLGPRRRSAAAAPRNPCEGARPPLPGSLFFNLRGAPFEAQGRPDVAVHVPPGFDASWRPGLVAYFHGWNGCVAAAVNDEPTPCSEGGAPRPGGSLARQVDDAGINALLVAVELRADTPTGEPGELTMPGEFRSMLHELLANDLETPLGCALDVDALDRVVLLAHSGGYQAAAAVLDYGDVPRVTEVVLLDALYGADESFSRWLGGQLRRFDGRIAEPLRFVDLYTCCGGTLERSRSMAGFAANALAHGGLSRSLYDDDGPGDPDRAALAHPVVIKRVDASHGDLPREYVRPLLAAAGFARIGGQESAP